MIASAVVGLVSTVIDRIIPDKAHASKVKAELLLLEQRGELDLLMKQIEVNIQEAKHESLFVSGWRPAVGWVCVAIFAYHGVLLPFIKYLAVLNGVDINILPEFDISIFTTVLMGMLGLGGLRTWEKYKGVNMHRQSKSARKYGDGTGDGKGNMLGK